MMPFTEHPWALVAAPILGVALAALIVLMARRRGRRLHRLGGDLMLARLVPVGASRRPWWRALLLGSAMLFACVAFAGPRWGTEQTIEHGNGVDIVLAMDASLSMLATDARPDRLQQEKDEARRLLALSSGDRFGLIAFAGRSYILTPLTVDQGALELFLDNLDPTVVGQAGSSLARAIRQGTDLLANTPTGSDRALVIMSDGEAFEPTEEISAAAKHAGELGITVIAVGFGTERGSTIPLHTPSGTTLKRDDQNQIVVTRYTPETLRAATAAANGTFIDAASTDKAARVRRALSSLHTQGRSSTSGSDRKPRFQLFALAALLLVLLDTFVAERRLRVARPAQSKVTRPPVARTAAAVLVALALCVPRAAHADDGADGDRLFREGRYREAAAAYERAIRSGNESPRLQYNLGTALLAAGRAEEAVAALERAAGMSRDLDIRYRALFNLGLINLRQARAAKGPEAGQLYTAALDAYKRALRVQPDAFAAKWNYELALQMKHKGGGGGGGQGGGKPQPKDPDNGQPAAKPSGALDPRQAAQLLSSAAREERQVQAKKQQENQPERPPGGKDW